MTTKNKKEEAAEKKGKLKVGGLKLNKETVKDLTDSEAKQIKGGAIILTGKACSDPCPATKVLCPHVTTVMDGCSPTVVGS